jgi:hypothetical protein
MELTMLDKIYVLKLRILQLERLRLSTSFSDEQFKNFRKLTDDATDIATLEQQLKDFRENYIEEYIPEEVMDLWDSGDYEVFTDKCHHRKFMNEIENDCSVEYFIEKFFELMGVSTSEGDNAFRISLYDLNDFDIYFPSEAVAMEFIEKCRPDCYTAFSRKEDYWQEEWSD